LIKKKSILILWNL